MHHHHRDPAIARRITLLTLRQIVATLALIVSSSSVAVAQQTEPTTIRTEIIDSMIEVRGENYILDHAALEEYPHGRGERIYISSLESLGFAEISFFDDEDSPDETIDVMLSEFETSALRFEELERGNHEGISYALASFRISGYEGYFYIEVAENIEGNVDLAQSFYNLNSDFAEQLDLVRGDVTIDGIPFLQEPVINVDTLVANHQRHLAELAATPVVNSVTFRSYASTVDVSTPVVIYDHFTSDILECVFFHSASGLANGLVGYLRDDSATAADVIERIANDPPDGAEEPEILGVRLNDDDSATGLYLVSTDEGEMLMLISVTREDEESWRIESLAAPPGQFLMEYQATMPRVKLNDRPLFDTIDVESLVRDADVAP